MCQSLHFFPRTSWKSRWRPCFQYVHFACKENLLHWWQFDYYFNIWLISCILKTSCSIMCVTPKVKEQFGGKFSSLVGTLVLKWATLGVLIQLLEPGVRFPPQCGPCQLHPLLYESFFIGEKSVRCWSLHYCLCVWHMLYIFLHPFSQRIEVINVNAGVIWRVLKGYSWVHISELVGRNNTSWNHLYHLSS